MSNTVTGSKKAINSSLAVTNETVATSQGTVIDLSFASANDAMLAVEAFRNSHTDQVGSDRDKAKKLRVATRGHLYANLGAFYGIAEKLLDPANETYLVEVLRAHGLKLADAGRNPFGPLVQLMFGQWYEIEYENDNGKVKKRKPPVNSYVVKERGVPKRYFVANRSAEKYAKVARYARSKGWKPKEFPAKIANFKSGMAGILQADTDATKGTDYDVIETAELVQTVLDLPPRTALDFAKCGIGAEDSERKFVGLWAEIVGGQALIRGVLPTSDATIMSFVERYAKDNAEKLKRLKEKSEKARAAA